MRFFRQLSLTLSFFSVAGFGFAADPATPISIIGVGDVMLGSNYPTADLLPPNHGQALLANVQHLLRDADLTFGNLEGTILNSGGEPKSCTNPSACYAFRMPEANAQNLVTAGFDLMSIANNHVGDFGETGRRNTLKVLKNLGIHTAGLLTAPSVVFEKGGVTYGFIAFAPNRGTVNLREVGQARQLVAALAQRSEIVIVSFHGGAEGSKYQHVPHASEVFYGENRGNVEEFAHAVIDAGADIVFGHGPHVTRAAELYKNRFIAYSLGNFCTYGRFNLSGPNGVAPIIKLRVNRQGEFLDGQVFSTYQVKGQGPRLDPEQRALQLLRELTASDFPNTPLRIANDGTLSKRP
jgi:hypothetical protein